MHRGQWVMPNTIQIAKPLHSMEGKCLPPALISFMSSIQVVIGLLGLVMSLVLVPK